MNLRSTKPKVHIFKNFNTDQKDQKTNWKAQNKKNLLKMLLKFGIIFLGPSSTSQLYSSSNTCMILINRTKEGKSTSFPVILDSMLVISWQQKLDQPNTIVRTFLMTLFNMSFGKNIWLKEKRLLYFYYEKWHCNRKTIYVESFYFWRGNTLFINANGQEKSQGCKILELK